MKQNKLTRKDIRDKLNLVFCDVFEDESIVIDESTTALDIDEWDSISHINLIVATEKAFSIRFTTKQVKNLENVSDLITLIIDRLES